MQRWEYKEVTQIIDEKTGNYYWQGNKNWKMLPWVRINKEDERDGWELVTAYTVVQKGQTEVHFWLRRSTLM